MVIRKCENCGKEFDRKDMYEYHINRKNPCVKKNDSIDFLKKEIDDLKNKYDALLAMIEKLTSEKV